MPSRIAKLFLRHGLAWACLILVAMIAGSAPWWWAKLATLPCASIVAALSIDAAREAVRHRRTIAKLETIAATSRTSFRSRFELVPYIDPVRASNRTGQVVYQFIRPLEQEGITLMTTTLEQLIASFLQIGLAKIDTKLSTATQQQIDSAVPTLVSAIVSVVVDLAENHKAVKTATTSTAK